jgi:XTP/dITP diphosphohydrolase
METQKRKLVIATSNPGKFNEIMEVMHDVSLLVLSSRELNLDNEVDEDGDTYEENAVKKARHYFAQTGFLTLAEDSGIQVDALAGELGVKTRRWGAGESASDEEWIAYFLEALKEVPDAKRTARFVCCAALMDEKGEVKLFKGVTEGRITHELLAPIYRGLPISSCFVPDGFDKVYAALGIAEKNKVSHRGKAMHAVKDALHGLALPC